MQAFAVNRTQAIILAAGAVIIILGASWYYRHESARISQEKYEDIHAFTSLKTEQILNWKAERLTDAAGLAGNHLFIDVLDEWIQGLGSEQKQYLDQLLELEMKRGYYNVLVYEAGGKLIISAKDDPDPLDEMVKASFSRAVAYGKAVLSDAYICPNGIVHLDAVAPVYNPEGCLSALVVMRSDAQSLLFPLLDSWPTPSGSAETLLVRRDGDYALVINELRHMEGGPFSLREPLSDTLNPVAQAITGGKGRFEGLDYRGVRVMADLRPVDDTPWYMVAKIDRSELMGELYYRARVILLFVGLFLSLATVIVIMIFRQRRLHSLETANRLYSFLSGVNQAVVRKNEPKELFDDICRIAVEVGGFRLAWVGWLDNESGEINPLSWRGYEEGFFNRVRINLKDEKSSRANSARAISEGRIVICDDVSGLEIAPVFREELIKRGYRSIAAIPLQAGGATRGNFTLYSSAPGFFTEQERRLLEEIGADINYAIDSIEKEKQNREAEEKIRQNERQMTTLIANLPGVVYRCSNDETWTMHYMSDEIETITGYKPEEICGNAKISYDEVTHPDDRLMIKSEIQSSLSTGEPWEFAYRVIKRDGEIRWVWERGRGVHDGDNQLLFLEGFITDITESKLAERALRESEERFRNMVNSMEDIIFTLDNQMRHTGVYGPWAEKMGSKPEYFLGRTAGDIFGHQAARPHEEAARKALAGEFVVYQWEIPGEEGAQYFQTSLSPIRDDSGVITGIVGIGRDVTALKKAEAALEEEVRRRTNLFEQTPVGIVIVDAESKRFLEFNRIAHEQLGYTREEFYKLGVADVVSRQTIDETLRRCDQVLNSGRMDFEDLQRAKDGSIRDMLVTMQAIEAGSRVLLQTICQDITERKRMEAEQSDLRNRAEVSSRLATVGEMAAGIAHEINNPLTGVIGFSELLSQEDLPPESREYVRYILDGSNRVKDIVRRLLTFARQEKPFKSRLDIHKLIDSTLELRSYVLSTAGIEVVKNYQPDLPWVSVDAGQMQQVFLNLIVNAEYAMKKTAGGGTLTITTSTRGKDVLIAFGDTGCGMDNTTRSRLFQPFFTTKEPGEGTGLGLALSRSIILDHNGDIAVESLPGNGTTFTVSLPQSCDGAPDEKALSSASSSAAATSRRILVVDDEPSVRLFVKKALSSSGYVIDEADTATSALERIKQFADYDLILADIRMPGMSGRDMYNLLEKSHPDLADRVLFVTGDVSDVTTRKFLSSNQIPFIAKPFTRGMLLEKLEEIIRGHENG